MTHLTDAVTFNFQTTALLAASRLEGVASQAYSILLVVLGIGFVIFVHELGHFLAAKFFGVKCEKFYIGFDVPIRLGPIQLPSSLGRFQWGETEYGIGIIPLGGYVKMLGQDDDPRNAAAEAERIRLSSEAQGPAESGGPIAAELGTPSRALDPRSFPAKPVFARMIIISAGVVMNLIFAVLMAAAAFLVGFPYEPAIVGRVTTGDPAWVAGMQPGDQVLQIGSMKSPDEHLRFRDTMEQVLVSGFRDAAEPVPVVLRGIDGELRQLQVVGRNDRDPVRKSLTLGFGSPDTTTLGRFAVLPRSLEQLQAKPDPAGLIPGDQVIAVAGEPLENHPALDSPLGWEVHHRLAARWNQPVEVELLRASEEGGAPARLTRVIPPRPMHTLGFGWQAGVVTAVAPGSPADEQGIELGDRLVAFQGEPIDDAMQLPMRVAELAGQQVRLELQRPGESARLELLWEVPDPPNLVGTLDPIPGPRGYYLPGSGLVSDAEPLVASLIPGGLAEQAGLQPGDRIAQLQLKLDPQERSQMQEYLSKESLGRFSLDSLRNPIWLQSWLELLPSGLAVEVDYQRGDQVRSTTLRVDPHPAAFTPDRGLRFTAAQRLHRTDSLQAAMLLGGRETWLKASGVLSFLKLMFTGRIGLSSVGGPGMIFVAASNEASVSVTRLLLFLTLLSANLAILNFLPIPALDGGHMVFLIAEAVRGKPVDENLQIRLTMAGVLFLLAVMALVIVGDVLKLVG